MQLRALIWVACFAPGLAYAQAEKYNGKTAAEWIAAREADATAAGDGRRQAYYALGQLRPATPDMVAVLAAGLKDRAIVGRRYAASSLGQLGPAAQSAAPLLIAAVRDPVNDEFIRLHAVRSLGQIAPLDAAVTEEATLLLAGLLESNEPALRVAAAHALWQVARDERGVTSLITSLQQPADQAPFDAALALVEIGVAAPQAEPAFVAALGHADPDVQRAAAKGLPAFGPQIIPVVSKAVTAGTVDPVAAAVALGAVFEQIRSQTLYNPQASPAEFSAAAKPLLQLAAPALAEAAARPELDEQARLKIMHELARLGPLAVPTLLAAAAADQEPVQAAAYAALNGLERCLPPDPRKLPNLAAVNKQLTPPLLAALKSNDRELKFAAIRLLAELQVTEAPEAVPVLRSVLREESQGSIRRYAAKALDQLQ